MKQLIMVSKDGCFPCHVIKPVFLQYKEEMTDVEFIYLNISQSQEAMDFAIAQNIMSVPTFLIKNGEEFTKFIGGNGLYTAIKELNAQNN